MSMPPPPQAPPAHGPPIAAGGRGPGRKWYLIPTFVLLLIGVPSLLAFLSGLDVITDGLIRVRAPGESAVALEEGNYTVFYEWKGEFEGESFTNSSAFPGMEAVVLSEDGEEVAVGPSIGDINYNLGSRAGYAVGRFEIDEPGPYVFVAQHTDPTNTQEYVLALGKDIGRATAMLVLGIIGMIVAGGIAFIVWLVVFIVRIRARKRNEAVAYGLTP